MNAELHILYHFRVRGIGAEGVHIAGIANGFRALGHTVAFVSPTGADPTRHQDSACAESFRTRFLHACADHAPQAVFECMELLYNIPARAALRQALREKRPDILYERYAFFNMAGAQTARRYGIPLILEVNELSGPDRVRKQVLKNMAQHIELKLFKQATLVVVVSGFLKDSIAQRLGDDRKIIIVPNGVDRTWLQLHTTDDERARLRAQWGIAPDRKIIGFIGGLVHWHRFDFLFDAMAGLRQTHPEAALLLVGEGPFEKRLKQMVERLGLATNVFFTGAVSHAAVRAYVDLFDVAIIPHSNEFRSPIKLFEYMGAGKAVLAPCVPPVATVIDNGNDGQLFDPLNVASLIETAGRLLSDPTRCRELGRKARLKVESNYLWEQHARRILERLKAAQK